MQRLRRFWSLSRPKMSVLMVCMGNICRSPMAEAVLRSKLEEAGLAEAVAVASAGTLANHVGASADPRAVARAGARGYRLQRHKARRIKAADYAAHRMILAMDLDNLESLRDECPAEFQHKLGLLLDHDAAGHPAKPGAVREVPDPYYSSAEAFDAALDLIEPACDGVVLALLRTLDAEAR